MRRLGLLFLLLVLTTACQLQGLAFIQDRRVEVTSPGYREIVDLPVTVDWDVTDEDLEASLGDDIQFGVYVDIDPQPPGEPLEYFARDDLRCKRTTGCPDEKYLRERGVYTTSETEMTFRLLPIAPGVDLERGDPDFHDVTIVLLNDEGVRIGESGWSITFEIDREGE
ncbi:MAG: hypothetical protein ACRDKT_05725 [Actinomycetota bacterium]